MTVPAPPRCRVVSGQKHPPRRLRAPSSLWVGGVPRTRGSDLKCKVASSMARRLGRELPSSFLHPAASSPSPGCCQRRGSHCAHSPGGWASSSSTGTLRGQPRVWRHWDLTWSHLLPRVLPRGTGQLPWSPRGSAGCPSCHPGGVCQARSPLPAARWAGARSQQARKERPVAAVQAGLLPSPLVACGHSSWGRGSRPG